jgi:transposase
MKRPEDFGDVFIHQGRVDMRKGINGLADVVEEAGMGALQGSNLFVFSGRRKHTIKVLYWDRSGFALWMKRLEEAKFPWPKEGASAAIQLTPAQFSWLLDGIDVWKIKPFEKVSFSQVS